MKTTLTSDVTDPRCGMTGRSERSSFSEGGLKLHNAKLHNEKHTSHEGKAFRETTTNTLVAYRKKK